MLNNTTKMIIFQIQYSCDRRRPWLRSKFNSITKAITHDWSCNAGPHGIVAQSRVVGMVILFELSHRSHDGIRYSCWRGQLFFVFFLSWDVHQCNPERSLQGTTLRLRINESPFTIFFWLWCERSVFQRLGEHTAHSKHTAHTHEHTKHQAHKRPRENNAQYFSHILTDVTQIIVKNSNVTEKHSK